MNFKRLLAFALLCGSAWGQTKTPLVQPHWSFVDNSGAACAGCSLSTFLAGTTTPTPTYTDASGTVQNTNPIILDASGSAFIWVGTPTLKLVLEDPFGTLIWTADNISSGGSGGVCGPASTIQISNPTLSGLTCDQYITINKVLHTINVGGPLPATHFTMTNLGTISGNWTFDITSPTTAALSLGGGTKAAGKYIDGATGQWTALPSPGSGTVSSVDVSVPAQMTVSGAPITTSGTIALGLNTTGSETEVVTATGAGATGNCAKWISTGGVGDFGAPCAVGFPIQKLWTGQTLCTPPTSTDGSCTGTFTFPASFAFADTSYGIFLQGFSSAGSGIFAVVSAKNTTTIAYTVWCTFGCSSYGTVTFDVFAAHL